MRTTSLLELTGIFALLLVASCTSSVSSDVVSFHEGNLPKGETITIEAADPEKAQSLEFRSYARLIGEELTKLGYSYVEDMDGPAALVAEVDYSVEAGPTDVVRESQLPYVRYHFFYGRGFDPYYFGFNNSWPVETISTPTYLRNLTMNIEENTEGGERVFEGRVQSRGIQSQLPEIMPYLVTAMFRNFPGESGVTKVVTLEENE
jgi:hypothetical protein